MNIKSKIESILFTSSKPLSIGKISKFIGCDKSDVKKEITMLMDEYNNRSGGIVIVKNLMQYQMMSSPDNSNAVKEFLKSEVSGELTQPALETLTIIAYRGPISKPEIDQIRGVNCGLILKNLSIRGLIESGSGKKIKLDNSDIKKDFLNDELYYNVTFDFLKFLGVKSVDELPDYDRLNDSTEKFSDNK